MVTVFSMLDRVLADVPPRSVLLASDFDGTLAEIRARPDDVSPLPGILNTLGRLTHRLGRVVIISGRATSALRAFLPISRLCLLGDYGLGEPSADERAALDDFAGDLTGRLATLPGAWM